jgi:hypothetical protein
VRAQEQKEKAENTGMLKPTHAREINIQVVIVEKNAQHIKKNTENKERNPHRQGDDAVTSRAQ